jgi:hypothetical protein
MADDEGKTILHSVPSNFQANKLKTFASTAQGGKPGSPCNQSLPANNKLQKMSS